MIRILAGFAMFFLLLHVNAQTRKWKGPSVDFSLGKLIVSENSRFLQFEYGTPFFIREIQPGNYFTGSP